MPQVNKLLPSVYSSTRVLAKENELKLEYLADEEKLFPLHLLLSASPVRLIATGK